MASLALPEAPAEEPRLCRPRAMTRCECAGLPFAEIARKIREERLSLAEVTGRTGCGGTCTACLPDLRAFLAED
jgi:bacterioferritin-associated ferredoxin